MIILNTNTNINTVLTWISERCHDNLFPGGHPPYSLREISNKLCIHGQPFAQSSSASSSTVVPGRVASKLRFSMVAAKADTHCFSFTGQPDRVGRPAGSSTDLVTWFSNLAGLVAQAISRSFLVSVSGSAKGTVF